MLGLAIALTIGCNSTITIEDDRCELDLQRVEPASGQPGDTVTGFGDGPFLDARDTVVFVDGVRAEVTSANGDTNDCARCIECRLEAECAVCDTDCEGSEEQSPGRIRECFRESTETETDLVQGEQPGSFCSRCEFMVEFVVPDVPAGPTEVWAIGEIGTSQLVPFEVESPPAP